jgi:hypothetical protein
MTMTRTGFAFLGLLAFAGTAPAAQPDPALTLSCRIDHHLGIGWAKSGVETAPRADDAEFLRRVYVELTGRIPSAEEARAFLADPTPEGLKRYQLINKLLKSPAYADHFTNVWRDLLVPEQRAVQDFQQRQGGIDAWLRKRFAENVGYDKMVRDLLTVPFGSERVRTGKMMAKNGEESRSTDPTPAEFYTAKDAKPENLASATSRLFLGVRIECAQCHDHPKAKWTREQFWGYAAFFAGISREAGDNGGGVRELFDKRELAIPGSSVIAEARYLTLGDEDADPVWKFNVGPRVTLAEWMTARDNPFFARAAVNRFWAYFFGIGLVDEVDDMRPDNPPSHPELLDELAKAFADSGYDVHFLIRAITNSMAYQLSSAGVPGSKPPDPRLFARMAVKPMTPVQIFDSLALATGYREEVGPPNPERPFRRDEARAEFLSRFSNTDSQRSIPQALTFMNGRFTADAVSLTHRRALADVADDAKLDTAGKVEALFLATLARRPTPHEAERFGKYVESGGETKDARQALADVFWALLNSAEFSLNH